MNGRASFIPNPTFKPRHGVAAAKVGENKNRFFQIWTFKLPNGSRFSPVRFLRHIGTKVEVALQYVSSRRRCSRKVSSASFTRSRSYADTLDSQRAEAIEDCIDFLNSSSFDNHAHVSRESFSRARLPLFKAFFNSRARLYGGAIGGCTGSKLL